jgi:hypothetical protein
VSILRVISSGSLGPHKIKREMLNLEASKELLLIDATVVKLRIKSKGDDGHVCTVCLEAHHLKGNRDLS